MQIALALMTLACAATQAPTPAPAAPASQRHFNEHSANIRRLGALGKLALGGRFGDMGLLLVRAASESEARSLFDADPSVAAGTFRVEVNEFRTFAPGCVGAPKAATPAP